jgi:ribosome-associated protein
VTLLLKSFSSTLGATLDKLGNRAHEGWVAKLLEIAVSASDEKFGHASTTIDLRGLQHACDAFVVTSGSTTLQARSIALEIEHRVHSLLGAVPDHVEGEKDGRWILLDYGDVVVHVFEDATREYYDLTHLWAHATQKVSASWVVPVGGP